MTKITTIESALQKMVSTTETVLAMNDYTVNWEDILSELEAYTERGCAPSDTARFIPDIVRVVRERAEHMLRQSKQFRGFITTGEAAESLTLYALCKMGIASTGENPEPFIRAALKADYDSPADEDVLRALIEAATSHITDAAPSSGSGEDEIPPLLDAGRILLDETGALNALICRMCELIEDPDWVAGMALVLAVKAVGETLKVRP